MVGSALLKYIVSKVDLPYMVLAGMGIALAVVVVFDLEQKAIDKIYGEKCTPSQPSSPFAQPAE
jgi:hypothetical protein